MMAAADSTAGVAEAVGPAGVADGRAVASMVRVEVGTAADCRSKSPPEAFEPAAGWIAAEGDGVDAGWPRGSLIVSRATTATTRTAQATVKATRRGFTQDLTANSQSQARQLTLLHVDDIHLAVA
jgi:hypothetical protein